MIGGPKGPPPQRPPPQRPASQGSAPQSGKAESVPECHPDRGASEIERAWLKIEQIADRIGADTAEVSDVAADSNVGARENQHAAADVVAEIVRGVAHQPADDVELLADQADAACRIRTDSRTAAALNRHADGEIGHRRQDVVLGDADWDAAEFDVRPENFGVNPRSPSTPKIPPLIVAMLPPNVVRDWLPTKSAKRDVTDPPRFPPTNGVRSRSARLAAGRKRTPRAVATRRPTERICGSPQAQAPEYCDARQTARV